VPAAAPQAAGEHPTAATDVTPVEASRPPVDATQVIPTVASVPAAAAAGGVPPEGSHTTAPPMQPDLVPPPPRRSAALIAGIAFGVLALLALLLIFFLTRGDDGGGAVDGDDEGVRLVVNRADAAGVPTMIDVTATVMVSESGVAPFRWVVPTDLGRVPSAVRQTDASGRTEFRWAPLSEDDSSTWTSTVNFREAWPDPTLGVVTVRCTLEGPTDEPLPIAVETSIENGGLTIGGVSVDALVTTFPNIRLRVGDVVTCEANGPVPPPFDPNAPVESTTTTSLPETTTSLESTTTVPESTTTTTVPETTTTTTTTSTTTTSTTTSTTTTTTTTTTVPALPPITDVLADEPDLGEFLTLLETGGLLADLESPIRPVTVFAPTDEAMAQFAIDRPDLDLTDPSTARAVALAHLSFGEALDAATLATRTSVLTEAGVDQPIDSPDPLTIAGAEVVREDLAGLDALSQVLDAVLPTGL